MPKTAQLMLPLVMPAQAQKHVTVNQALAILDAVTQLQVQSALTTVPPRSPVEGAAYLVPQSASEEWKGKAPAVAVYSNSGWVFLTPRAGWRAWDQEQAAWWIFDGSGWVANALAISPKGARLSARIVEFDHTFSSGSTNTTTGQIPAGAQVIGVSGRVIVPITGTGISGWRVGVTGSSNRYGQSLGISLNSYVAGLSGAPVTYYSNTPLLLSAEGGNFSAGVVRLALHLLEIEPPRAI